MRSSASNCAANSAGFRRADAALAAAAHTPDEARYDRPGARHDAALARLLRTPAPSLAALSLKLDLLVVHQAWELTFAPSCLAALKRDARILAHCKPGPKPRGGEN